MKSAPRDYSVITSPPGICALSINSRGTIVSSFILQSGLACRTRRA
jgi:hypothetical protein